MRISLRPSVTAVLIGLALLAQAADAREYRFDPSMLGEAASGADFSLFNEGVQLPGIYTVDILLNGERVDTQDVNFALQREEGRAFLYPCLSVEQLSRYGVRTEDFPALDGTSGCAVLSALPGATYEFRFASQQLQLSVPQIHLRSSGRGLASRELWDDGLPVFLMNYSANGSRTELSSGHQTDSSFVQLSPGINLGAWRLRNQSSWQKQGAEPARWQTGHTYAERGLYALRSTFSVGDRNSSDPVFSSIPFRGVMLASDESMVPYTDRAYAPVVRGIARTQARVEVRQNGYTLYDATVAPGPFALRDLALSGASGGVLEVMVRETDGTVQTFNVPYQTPALALKEGHLNYSLLAGQYRPGERAVEESPLGQASLMYGLPYDLTVYGGIQGAQHYQAGAVGLGISLGDWGATSLDIIGSRAQLRGRDAEDGTAWRLRYSKIVSATNTTLTVAGYRHATPGFATLEQTLNSYDRDGGAGPQWLAREQAKMRSTTSVMVSQTLGQLGSTGLSYSRTDYWHQGGEDTSYGLSYGVGLPGGITATLSQSQTRTTVPSGSRGNERLTSLWLSMPLPGLTGSNMRASYQATTARGRESHSAGLSGNAFDRRMNWDVRQSMVRETETTRSSYGRASWSGTYGQTGVSYSHSSGQRTMAGDVSGGMVLHGEGLTLGQTFGGSVALVSAPGAVGVPVYGMSGVKTDFRGYALHASVMPYQENVVSLDPLGLPDDVDITQTDVRVIPTRGAVVPARFATRAGGRALMSLTRAGGSPVPFGALVNVVGAEGNAGVVGSEGEVYLTGLPASGELRVRWKDGQCIATYALPDSAGVTGVHNLKASCR